jgi:hypothetical protein
MESFAYHAVFLLKVLLLAWKLLISAEIQTLTETFLNLATFSIYVLHKISCFIDLSPDDRDLENMVHYTHLWLLVICNFFIISNYHTTYSSATENGDFFAFVIYVILNMYVFISLQVYICHLQISEMLQQQAKRV